jgi:hypothetical protein
MREDAIGAYQLCELTQFIGRLSKVISVCDINFLGFQVPIFLIISQRYFPILHQKV